MIKIHKKDDFKLQHILEKDKHIISANSLLNIQQIFS